MLYVRTITTMFSGHDIVICTPYNVATIRELDSGKMSHVVKKRSASNYDMWADQYTFNTLQLCIEIDGSLYMWHEWKV